MRRVRRWRYALALLLTAYHVSACTSPFAWHYQGKSLSQLNGQDPWLAAPAGSAAVITTDDFERSLADRLRDGWVLLGTATWTGIDGGTEAQAREYAAELGASEVVWAKLGAGYRNLAPQPEQRTEGVAVSYHISKGKLSTGTVTMPTLTGGCAPSPASDASQARLYTVKSSFWARRLRLPVLGAVTRSLPPSSEWIFAPSSGIAVMCVVRGSPAEAAGLAPGDVLLDLGGTEIRTDEGLTGMLKERRGTVQRLRYRRDGIEADIDVRLND